MRVAVIAITATLFACQQQGMGDAPMAISRERAIQLLHSAEPSPQDLASAVLSHYNGPQAAPGEVSADGPSTHLAVKKTAEKFERPTNEVIEGDEAIIEYEYVYDTTSGTEVASATGALQANFMFDGKGFSLQKLEVKETAYGVTDLIVGKVTHCELGIPLGKATILIKFREGHEKRIYTFEDGAYTIRAVKGDTVTISAWLEGYVLQTVETTVPSEENFALCPFQAPPPDSLTLYGTVRDLEGTPLSGATLVVLSTLQQTLGSTLSNALGAYEIPGLPLDSATVTASLAGKTASAQISPTLPATQIDLIIPNHAPTCSLHLSSTAPKYGEQVTVTVNATDQDGDVVALMSSVSAGELSDTGSSTYQWAMPVTSGRQTITVVVSDGISENDCVSEVTIPQPFITKLAGGGYHTCAIRADQTAVCWGENADGQLGNGTKVTSGSPVTVSTLTGVAEISLGAYHSCARTNEDSVYCWGRNNFGQLGDGSYTLRTTPVQVSGLATGVSQIAAGNYSTCALIAPSGKVQCWGANNYGQLGTGTYNASVGQPAPSYVVDASGATLTGVERIEAGGHHVCALKNGALFCWGGNGYGQLGLGHASGPERCDSPYRTDPFYCSKRAVVNQVSNFTDFSVGQYSVCGVLDTTEIKCWGVNWGYHLGTNAPMETCNFAGDISSCSLYGVRVTSETGIATGFTKLAEGATQSFGCAMAGQNEIICWGAAKLEDWSNPANGIPHTVSFTSLLPALSTLVAGHGHVCGSTSYGEVYCWGSNAHGQLGAGDLIQQDLPVLVEIP